MVDLKRNAERLAWFTTEELTAEVARRAGIFTSDHAELYRCGVCGQQFDGQIHYCPGAATSTGELGIIDRSRGTA